MHHPPGTAGDTKTRRRWKKRIQCCGHLRFGVPNLKFPQPFLEQDGEGEERFCLLSRLLLPALSHVEGLWEFLPERCFAIFSNGACSQCYSGAGRYSPFGKIAKHFLLFLLLSMSL
jgi:hypothetical protein